MLEPDKLEPLATLTPVGKVHKYVAELLVDVVVVVNVALVPPQNTGAPKVVVVIERLAIEGVFTVLLTTNELVQPTA